MDALSPENTAMQSLTRMFEQERGSGLLFVE